MIVLNGLKIIMTFEQFRSKPYLCPAGVPTIGYGHTKGVSLDDSAISITQGLILLFEDIAVFERGVKALIKTELNDNQFAAVVSLAFNIGLRNLRASALRQKLNRGDFVGAAYEFPKWRRANGKIMAGLVRRRLAEQILFNS